MVDLPYGTRRDFQVFKNPKRGLAEEKPTRIGTRMRRNSLYDLASICSLEHSHSLMLSFTLICTIFQDEFD